jgi:hypothetical protein
VLGALFSLVLSWLLMPCLIRREFDAHVAGLESTSAWSLQWFKSGDPQPHGVWLDPSEPEDADLEVLPSGHANTPDLSCEFWFYSLKTDEGFSPDLKALIAPDAGRASEGWIPFEQGPGVIYTGQKPGHLRIRLPGRFATLYFAKTERGGDVTLKYRGQTTTINTYAPTITGAEVVVPTTPAMRSAADIRQRLPIYSLAELWLSWKAPEGAPVSITNARLRFTLFGRTLWSRPCTIEARSQRAAPDPVTWILPGPSSSVRPKSGFALGPGVYALGTLAAFAGLLLLRLAVQRLAPTGARLSRSPWLANAAVALIVIFVNAGVAWKTPLFITQDGIDYLDAADWLAKTGTFARFPDYKAPGVSVLLAAAMRISKDFLDTFGWFEAGLGMLSALMAYALVRARAPRPWALLAALVVGLHPVLLTYECYLLREGPSAALVLAVALVLVRLSDRLATNPHAGWALTITLAALCAAGAYLRENLQMLLLFVPVIVLLTPASAPWRTRALRAAVILLLTFTALLPRALPLWRVYGSFGVVSPKAQGNRLLAAWSNELADGNDTAFFSEDQWESLRRDDSSTPLSDYEFTQRLYAGVGVAHRSGADVAPPGEVHFADTEVEARLWVNEAVAREPLRAARDALVAFVNQLGLWNFHTLNSASDEWYARPLRGDPLTFSTNFMFDTESYLRGLPPGEQTDRLRALVTRARRSTEDIAAARWPALFGEWWWAFRASRPVFAALFLVGLVFAIRRRDRALVGAASIALLSILAAATVIATPTDRFGVPFIPVIVCMAAYAAGTWRQGCRTSLTPHA